MKTTWDSNKSATGKTVSKWGMHLININGILTNNWQKISNLLNNYFLTIADKIIDNNGNDKMGQSNNNSNPPNYMLQSFKHPFLNFKFNYT